MTAGTATSKSIASLAMSWFWMALGAFLAAFSIKIFLLPNRLIDGGIVGVAMICGNLFGVHLIPYFYVVFTIPFAYFAYRTVGRTFVIQMILAMLMFAGAMVCIDWLLHSQLTHLAPFHGDILEVVVIGGCILGMGIGLIIRIGACLDGTEILGIVINKKTGFTVGQTVFVCNIFVFGGLGFVFHDWHPPLLSLITYMVVAKVLDTVVVGLDETKSVLIISTKYKDISKAIIHELGLGLTIMYGRGGFSGSEKEILYVITERLQLASLKELVLREDPAAFIAVESLHEVANGNPGKERQKPMTTIKNVLSSVFSLKK